MGSKPTHTSLYLLRQPGIPTFESIHEACLPQLAQASDEAALEREEKLEGRERCSRPGADDDGRHHQAVEQHFDDQAPQFVRVALESVTGHDFLCVTLPVDARTTVGDLKRQLLPGHLSWAFALAIRVIVPNRVVQASLREHPLFQQLRAAALISPDEDRDSGGGDGVDRAARAAEQDTESSPPCPAAAAAAAAVSGGWVALYNHRNAMYSVLADKALVLQELGLQLRPAADGIPQTTREDGASPTSSVDAAVAPLCPPPPPIAVPRPGFPEALLSHATPGYYRRFRSQHAQVAALPLRIPARLSLISLRNRATGTYLQLVPPPPSHALVATANFGVTHGRPSVYSLWVMPTAGSHTPTAPLSPSAWDIPQDSADTYLATAGHKLPHDDLAVFREPPGAGAVLDVLSDGGGPPLGGPPEDEGDSGAAASAAVAPFKQRSIWLMEASTRAWLFGQEGSSGGGLGDYSGVSSCGGISAADDLPAFSGRVWASCQPAELEASELGQQIASRGQEIAPPQSQRPSNCWVLLGNQRLRLQNSCLFLSSGPQATSKQRQRALSSLSPPLHPPMKRLSFDGTAGNTMCADEPSSTGAGAGAARVSLALLGEFSDWEVVAPAVAGILRRKQGSIRGIRRWVGHYWLLESGIFLWWNSAEDAQTGKPKQSLPLAAFQSIQLTPSDPTRFSLVQTRGGVEEPLDLKAESSEACAAWVRALVASGLPTSLPPVALESKTWS